MTHKTIQEMTNDEIMKQVIEDYLQGRIPLKKYLRLFDPEEKKVAIETRIAGGHWEPGIHFNTPKGAHMWVNLHAIREWAAKVAPVPEPSDEVKFASEHARDTLG